MNNYQIVPWAELELPPGVTHEQYVPPELEALARQVMELYDMQVHDMLLITSKPDKGGAIWRIGTNKGNRSLKVLHRRPQRSLFSIGAQEYMSSAGARVPAFIPTKDGNLYVEAGGKMWIVTDWVEPLLPVSKIDLEGAAELCYGLGEFHKFSKGYIPPFGAQKSSRLYKWAKYYDKIIAKIGWFRDIAVAYPENAASANLLSVVNTFEAQARDIIIRFNQSPYARMVAKGEPHWGLVHQDYGWSNGQMGPGGIWVIDLDGVSYDLPIRDLRKLVTIQMDDMGVWDLTWIRGMIDAYHQANPIDQETFEILLLDMSFPNEFYKHIKEVVFEPVPFLQTQLDAVLQRVMATETSKWQALAELEKDKAKYAAGDYATEGSEAARHFQQFGNTLPGNKLVQPQEGAVFAPGPELIIPEMSQPEAAETPFIPELQLPEDQLEAPEDTVPEPFHAFDPDAGRPDVIVPDISIPRLGIPDASLPDVIVPDISIPRLGIPDASLPDAIVPDFSVPPIGIPDTGLPLFGIPNASIPRASVPFAGVPHPAIPDSVQLQQADQSNTEAAMAYTGNPVVQPFVIEPAVINTDPVVNPGLLTIPAVKRRKFTVRLRKRRPLSKGQGVTNSSKKKRNRRKKILKSNTRTNLKIAGPVKKKSNLKKAVSPLLNLKKRKVAKKTVRSLKKKPLSTRRKTA